MRFFLSLDRSFRSKKLGTGSGLVAWFPMHLENTSAISQLCRPWVGWGSHPYPSLPCVNGCPQPVSAVGIPHTIEFLENLCFVCLFSLQTRTFPVLLCLPPPHEDSCPSWLSSSCSTKADCFSVISPLTLLEVLNIMLADMFALKYYFPLIPSSPTQRLFRQTWTAFDELFSCQKKKKKERGRDGF